MSKRHNMSGHPCYSSWLSLKQRCLNPRNPFYRYYGGRGITVCERWKSSFPAFVQDMGARPEGFTIERINNDLGYSPENCRWASRKEQQGNRRIVRTITIEGITYKAYVLSKISGLKTDTIIERAKTAKTIEELLDPQRKIFYAGLAMSPNRRNRTHCKHGHEYTESNTYWTPAGYRQCRACHKVQNDKRRK